LPHTAATFALIMSGTAELWSWIAVAGLGLFHGINPAMGWLFAAALGLHRRSQTIVLLSLVPIALGHAAAVAVVLIAVLALGIVVDWTILSRVMGVAIIAWAVWQALYAHRRRVRIGMRTGLAGLALWSFLMAAGHGAGLMLVPVVTPLCLAAGHAQGLSKGALGIAVAALAVHTAAMLTTIAVVSVAVYNWAGVAFLRRGWINLDLLWIAALIICGAALVVM
jgi:hypothetical protein